MYFTSPLSGHNVRISDAHLEELAASGITPETAMSAGLYTEVDPVLIQKLLNWPSPPTVLGPCLVYPYLDAFGKPTGYHRLKPSTPRMSKKKGDSVKTVKYEGPKGEPNRLYIPPGTRAALADPKAPLMITEGEKKALRADEAGFSCLSVAGVWAWQKKRMKGEDGHGSGPRELIDDLVAVAWNGRRVFLAFDSDGTTNPSVRAALREFTHVLRMSGAIVIVVSLPSGSSTKKVGLDDFLVANGPDALRKLLANAETPSADIGESEEKEKKPSAADQLAGIASSMAELWHDSARVGYASIGQRTMAVKSKPFRLWLTQQYRALNDGRVPNSEAIANALNAIEAQAVIDGNEYEAHVRVALHAGRVYLHLADDDDTVIEIDAYGYRECPEPPVRFRRSGLALPRPKPGGSLEDLRMLLNLEDLDQFALIVGFLSGALYPGYPQPLLVANGEQGSGKTTAAKMLKAILDPSSLMVRCEPKEVRDLMIAARNNHLLVFDNLSHLPPWLSDALCRLATGGGFATRELYTDDGEVIFDALRPVILNGIEDFVTRGDLLERSILLRLPPIPKQKRLPESEHWAKFHALLPKLLGAILQRVSGGLRVLPDVKLDCPRMADFARWCVACEQGASETPRFLAAYSSNQSGAHEQALEGSSLAGEIVSLMNGRDVWEGTATDLLNVLTSKAPNPAPRDWPKTANTLSGKLKRLAPNLRQVHGIDFNNDRQTDATRKRIIYLRRLKGVAEEGSSTNCKNHVAASDDPKDATRSHTHGSSAVLPTKERLSDDRDDVDDHSRTTKAVSVAEFAQFLDMH